MRSWTLSLWILLAPLGAAAQEFTTLKGHGGPIMDISVNAGTGQVATASFDNSVGLWEGRVPTWLEGHEAAANAVAFLGPSRAVSSGDDFALILWDIGSGNQTRLEGHKGKVRRLSVSPEGTWIASASWDGSVGLWPATGGAPRFFSGHDAGVNDVVFSADGQHLYSASADGTIRQWDLTGGAARIVVSHGFGVNRLILSPGGDWLAYGAVDGVTRVIDPVSGETIADFTLERRPILSMAYHAETNQLAVGDGHGFIMMIDTARWSISRDFRAMRQGPVWALDFGPDGSAIYAGGLEDVVFSWPVALLDEYDPAGGETRSFLRDADAMPNGERQFMRKCSICHALTPPPSRKAGPTLYGVFGRRAGTVPGYRYSEILSGSDIIWSDDTIDQLFDLGPDHYIPGSKMPMQRITQAADRRDLVEFLREAAGNGEN
ncbi:c-type cytochrome [uncultured Roseovarius sp.]|uniref:c-type cytochrome n=1 Tax=uncultured Roseovarius sp. TaxID=293344 RepID=UPI002624F29B|nr:c-type cytochrome [uncultured Roseovarius sp.]